MTLVLRTTRAQLWTPNTARLKDKVLRILSALMIHLILMCFRMLLVMEDLLKKTSPSTALNPLNFLILSIAPQSRANHP